MKKLFLFLGVVLIFASCKKNEPKPSLSSDAAIKEKVNALYTQYGKSTEAIYNQPIPDNLFSQDLKKILDEAIHASKADIEKVKKSDHPDEKPLIFEGAMFSSLYEGFTSYKIKSINISESTEPLGSQADVNVEFEYSHSSPKVIWTDKIHLINAFDAGWRIDNIVFDTIGNSKDLKTGLQSFIKYAKEQNK
ncbi:hypothetical protein [Chryseobacterium sp. IT-36CA2]|uniref:hypothetical protein n=1 Tax=Chryseobacterium sp. IT-36CA2 TaxID=3026460 RepID=UPI0039E0D9FA